jgi:alpha-beta hydrolase superfamily lysophospholipase
MTSSTGGTTNLQSVRRERDPDRVFDGGTGLRSQQVRLLDGRTMRTVVAGNGDPLVIFEGGIAVCASMWMTVQRLVAEETRTFAYDRAGCGGSADDQDGRSLQRMADDLAAVLDAADEDGPAISWVRASAPPFCTYSRGHILGACSGSSWSTRPSVTSCERHRFG